MSLTTFYMGLKLKSPLVPSACQALTDDLNDIRRMEDAGAGAVILYSLFEEQLREDALELEQHTTRFDDSFSEASSFFPEAEEYLLGPEEYLSHIKKTKEALDIPVIASLNGSTQGGWTSFAKQIQSAGADALELNLYKIPTNMASTSESVESEYLQIVRDVRSQVSIPIAVKVSPFFTNFAYMAKQFEKAGANALTLFNRFYQPDIDLETLTVKPNVILSHPMSSRLPLRWTALLYGRTSMDLAVTSGIYTAEDCLKLLMAGAKVTMLCSVLLRYGIDKIAVINQGITEWLAEKGYSGLEELQGSMSQAKCGEPSAYERAQYIRSLHDFRPSWKRRYAT